MENDFGDPNWDTASIPVHCMNSFQFPVSSNLDGASLLRRAGLRLNAMRGEATGNWKLETITGAD